MANKLMTTIEIPGEPVPLKRPRFCRGRVYDSQTVEKNSLRWRMKVAHKGDPLKGPIEVRCEFIFEPAASASKTKKAAMNGKAHTQKPDTDNLIKLLLDSGNKVLWGDDSQVASLSGKKTWGSPARTIIHFQELQEIKHE
jgi:Holliday junction resolvase RusA-like endonuclease